MRIPRGTRRSVRFTCTGFVCCMADPFVECTRSVYRTPCIDSGKRARLPGLLQEPRAPIRESVAVTTTLGERIALARKRAKLGQGQLGDALGGASRSRVSEWEGDKAVPEGRYLLKLPGVLRVNGHWLLTGDGEISLGESSDATLRLELIQQLADPALEIPAEVLRGLKMLARGRDLIAEGEAGTEQTG